MNKGIKFLKILTIGILCMLLLGLVVMSLWNWLVPPLFHGPELTFWQALGLFVLARIFFGGWRGGRCRGSHAWKHRYYEKLKTMSPEERERFKEKMREKWCTPHQKDSGSAGSNV